jgi:ACS family tartrate transporter-like MFS transporter
MGVIESLERRVVGKVSRRLLPYLFLLYVIAYLDRINVGVARLQITRDLPIDESAWGLGMGIFFAGYFLFEVPSNLVLARVGARRWIARIMILWGLISSCTMFVRGQRSFYLLRFLLGAAEAGFFPGILYYMTHWFREKDRAKAVALFMTAGAITGVIGSPLSGLFLEMDKMAGLKGWQWLFLMEGIPAVLLGFSVLALLTETPREATWLAPEEREWLAGEIDRERAAKDAGTRPTVLDILRHPTVLHLTAIYFLMACGSYGFELWLPEIVKSISGAGNFRVTLLVAVPYIVGAVVMVGVAQHSDRTGERRKHVALSALLAAGGFISAALLRNPLPIFISLSLAWAGVKALHGPFWAVPPAFLSGPGAAVGLALINSVGNLGGWAGPWLAGFLRKETQSFQAGFLVSGLLLLGSALLGFALPRVQGPGFRPMKR